MQQGVFHRFKLSYRILALRNMIANGGPQAISLVDALQYISRVWHVNILENSFDNLTRETDVAEELRELQRLVGVYSGESGPELARDYVELERVVEQGGYSETNHHLAGGYGCYAVSGGLTDEYGNLFGVGHSEDTLALAPAISSYQGALLELRRLQQFALKVNDYELQEILFNARCAAEDRSAARVIAEKYLNMMQ
ncbi:tigger transposable element-derived protein 6-like [Tropilaelaps mercedesae]|uniref:Tigger transposable element-derived protein 6-like n=1 Tax=Tropilaelaps mercedesae TaxID=418985 RepID=A0A1V9X8L1_9ACAR|nr:tigger transposable element-derived protein 6-like [Tropilaelaps mercedesae]